MFSETVIGSQHSANLAKHRGVFTRQRSTLRTSQILCVIFGITCINCSNDLSGQTDLTTDAPDTSSTGFVYTIQPDVSETLPHPSDMPPVASNASPAINSDPSSTLDPSSTSTPTPTENAAPAPASEPMQPSKLEPEAGTDVHATEPPTPTDDWAAACERVDAVRAHGAPTTGDTSPYRVEAGTEEVRRFYFKAPQMAGTHLLKSRAIRGTSRVVHHWSLYLVHDVQVADGALLFGGNLVDALRLKELRYFLGGGPGNSELTLPQGVGMRVPQGANVGYALEVHYFNPTDQAQDDASGVELCLTSKPVQYEAAVHLLGRNTFRVPARGPSEVTSTCKPVGLREPVHMFAVTPHAHERATHAEIVLNRSAGEQTSVLDQPFDPSEQHTYPITGGADTSEILMNPGDTLTTTCSYVNPGETPIESGADAEQEMCLMLMWAWPAGALHNDLLLGTQFGVEEDLDCMDL